MDVPAYLRWYLQRRCLCQCRVTEVRTAAKLISCVRNDCKSCPTLQPLVYRSCCMGFRIVMTTRFPPQCRFAAKASTFAWFTLVIGGRRQTLSAVQSLLHVRRRSAALSPEQVCSAEAYTRSAPSVGGISVSGLMVLWNRTGTPSEPL
jgi:hypothetical protein